MCSDSFPISILSVFFLYHPYIPSFLIQRIFYFLVLYYYCNYICIRGHQYLASHAFYIISYGFYILFTGEMYCFIIVLFFHTTNNFFTSNLLYLTKGLSTAEGRRGHVTSRSPCIHGEIQVVTKISTSSFSREI